MPDEVQSSPVVENTPAVSMPETPVSASDVPAAAPTPTVVDPAALEATMSKLLADMEKRLAQTAKDTAKSAVHKALGIPAKAPAPVTPTAPTAPATPTAPTTESTTESTTQPLPTATTEVTDPLVALDPVTRQAYAYLQEDGVPVADGVDPIVLEAYRTQAQLGVRLEATDPEFATIDNSSITAYLSSVAAAAAAKRARLVEDGTLDADNTLALTAPVMTPGLFSGAVPSKLPHEGKTGADTLSMFFSKGS